MLAYNGSVPGPTLQVERVEITVHTWNDGDIATTVHWHCLRLEHRYDGVSARDPTADPGRRLLQLPGAVSPTPASTGITRTSGEDLA
jgi:FtsP/CotA-like multicopper oxidase with cupredoxin domain